MRVAFDQRETDAGTRRVIRLTECRKPSTIFFEFAGERLPQPRTLDAFACATVFAAMQEDAPLVIEGPLSVGLLRNLATFQEAWACWKPERYRRVEVRPERVVDATPRPGRTAISAFSGGVDATFSILRHAGRQLGDASLPLRSALMVHGFDVQLWNRADFDGAAKRAGPFLHSMGVRLRIVRTNLKQAAIQDWEDSFIAQLAACMHGFSHECGDGAAPSGEPYNALVLPWGQN